MTSKRLYFVLTALIVIALAGLLAGAYGANGLLASQATKLTGLKAKSQALGEEQQSLADAKKDIQKYGQFEKIAKVIVPQDKDQAEAVREIVNLASANDVTLASVTFPNSTLGSATPGTATTGTTAPASAAVPSAAASAAANSSANKLSQLEPIKNIPGVYLLQITLANDSNHPVKYTPFIGFLSALEHNRRTAQVSTINLEPNPDNPALFTFSLTLNEYIKP